MERPNNTCGTCGYTWSPRGHDMSARCPSCRATTVMYSPEYYVEEVAVEETPYEPDRAFWVFTAVASTIPIWIVACILSALMFDNKIDHKFVNTTTLIGAVCVYQAAKQGEGY